MDKTKLNEDIHLKILKSSKLFLEIVKEGSDDIYKAFDYIEEIIDSNLNEVTEIYIYENAYGNTENELKNTVAHFIIEFITSYYTDENILYIKEIILIQDNKKSDFALDFLLKIGERNRKFRDTVLDFLESNDLNNFSKNKLNLIGFYMGRSYYKCKKTKNLYKIVTELYKEKYSSQENKNQISSDLKIEQVSQNVNKIDHNVEFKKLVIEHHRNAFASINQELYNEIIKTTEIISGTKENVKIKEIIDKLTERFKNEDLNQITNLFIYCQRFLSSNEEPLSLPSQLCIAIGKLFTNKNLHYTASKIYSEDEIDGGCALSFLGHLAMHEQHTSYVLNFIKENFKGFSKNKKTECVFQLKETLPENEIAKQIIKDSGITKYELIFSTEEDATSTPITFMLDNFENKDNNSKQNFEEHKSPWWKFW